jgi:NADH:ubiquinone oxidoreductase subunit B-like Fe-S oxidoreductase
MPNEPFPNESLALSKKTYATINHKLLCHELWLWMRLFAIWSVNLGLALCSVKLVTLKE